MRGRKRMGGVWEWSTPTGGQIGVHDIGEDTHRTKWGPQKSRVGKEKRKNEKENKKKKEKEKGKGNK